MTVLLRRNKPIAPKIKLKRVGSPLKLIRRIKPKSKYCERVPPGVLPAPLLCSWVGEMYECCRNCKKKISYSIWKEGSYAELKKELEEGRYDERFELV